MNTNSTATARACANIAFIKYWGNANSELRLPVNSSFSMNLDGLYAETSVRWASDLENDTLVLNGAAQVGPPLQRVQRHLEAIRKAYGISRYAEVISTNNFPMGAGIASSAAAFAALSKAACSAAGINLSERELSTIARLGSGSASRSIPEGFVRWIAGATHNESYAESIAPRNYWDLHDVIAVVSNEHKETGSSEGHQSANTSDLQSARVSGADERLKACEEAFFDRDFPRFAEVVELDSNLMHAVMLTSRPPLMYWQPASLTLMKEIPKWRRSGIGVCYTLDAGPNVHCICLEKDTPKVIHLVSEITGVTSILNARPGGPAMLVSNPFHMSI